ncbi:hypothetical protein Cadr_000005955 [Camelus dromedarius]|uniref:Uncharacterized protein n=1 Tax=Camelus dromedarius TaxID=9838 RepID=A0A5N4E1C1_CAMDR|nr:hypothetical protein Cadr_000005955 [Camelus dromedarius]
MLLTLSSAASARTPGMRPLPVSLPPKQAGLPPAGLLTSRGTLHRCSTSAAPALLFPVFLGTGWVTCHMPGVIPASASQQAPNMTRFSYPGVAGGEAAGKQLHIPVPYTGKVPTPTKAESASPVRGEGTEGTPATCTETHSGLSLCREPGRRARKVKTARGCPKITGKTLQRKAECPWKGSKQLSKDTANCPNIYRGAVLCVPHQELRGAVPPGSHVVCVVVTRSSWPVVGHGTEREQRHSCPVCGFSKSAYHGCQSLNWPTFLKGPRGTNKCERKSERRLGQRRAGSRLRPRDLPSRSDIRSDIHPHKINKLARCQLHPTHIKSYCCLRPTGCSPRPVV